MSKQGDIRKFCLHDGGDSEETDKEQAQREKRKLQQKSYKKKNRKKTIIDTWVEEYDWVGTDGSTLFCQVCREFPTISDQMSTLVMNSTEVQHMKHIMILILIMLTISPTTAECERGFRSVNNIKTTARTSMKQEALSSLVRIKVDGPDLMEYNPTESIINWLNSDKGTRHIKGHICTGPRGP